MEFFKKPFRWLRSLIACPDARMLYISTLPDYLRLGDCTDPEWVIKYKKHWWSRWKYLTDGFGVPRLFCKSRAEEVVTLIRKRVFDL